MKLELIKEIYQAVDDNLKRKIEIEVPELRPTLEVGKWYRINWRDGEIDLFFAKEIKEDRMFFYDNYYRNGNLLEQRIHSLDISELFEDVRRNIELATLEEVKTALVKEAKRRGFKDGVKFNAISVRNDGRNLGCTAICDWDFCLLLNNLQIRTPENTWKTNNSNPIIFDNGTWATIITEPTEKDLLIEKLNELKGKASELETQINKL